MYGCATRITEARLGRGDCQGPEKLGRIPKVGPLLEKILNAAQQYRGKGSLVLEAFALSFIVHFTTAAMYWFTAIGVGAVSADFGMVVFASSIQIFATVMSPFTIAGEGFEKLFRHFYWRNILEPVRRFYPRPWAFGQPRPSQWWVV